MFVLVKQLGPRQPSHRNTVVAAKMGFWLILQVASREQRGEGVVHSSGVRGMKGHLFLLQVEFHGGSSGREPNCAHAAHLLQAMRKHPIVMRRRAYQWEHLEEEEEVPLL